MITLEITIQRKIEVGWPIVAEQMSPGALPTRHEEVLTLEPSTLLQHIDPRAYGVGLGQALFHGQIRDALTRSLATSQDNVRVLLFVEAEDLRTLRWERLCAPLIQGHDNGWDFLALHQRTPFSLYLPSLTDRRFPPIGQRDLRALVLIASPSGLEQYRLSPFNAGAVAAQIEKALNPIPFDLLGSDAAGLVPGALGPASLDTLCQRLTEMPYTLVHVVCHGNFARESGETSLFLADKEHQLDRIESTRLLERLGRLRGRRGLPHFAFLATCDSAAPEAEGALGGLAQRLVRELGMPAVIAMTEKVSVETAQLLTANFYTRLQRHGEVDRALVEAATAMAERSDVTIPVIYSRLGNQPLFSHSLERELTIAEIDYGLELLSALLDERSPVLKSRFEETAMVLRRYLSTEVAFLEQAEAQERQAALDEADQIAAKALDLGFKAICLGRQPPQYDTRCPFQGLVAFGSSERDFFFGRTALTQKLYQHLMHNPFLAILGPSGSGKSSLVLAGLLPLWQREEPQLRVQIMTPGVDPVAVLTAATEPLSEADSAGLPGSNLPSVLVVDQFEEIFTLCSEEAQRSAFFQQLLALMRLSEPTDLGTSDSPGTVRIILTMRADFWGECARYPQLSELMLAHQMLIAPMNAIELRSAVEQQARAVGLRFEADLAHTVLDDVAGEPGAMPLLQHGLRELWHRRYGRWLVAAEYRKMGGVKQAIARAAEVIYARLSSIEQSRIRAIFTRLTRLDEEALPGDVRRDTRRRVAIEDLVPSGEERSQTIVLIQQLVDERLLVSSRNPIMQRDEVEVAHEALIREWPRLRAWIDEDVEGMRIQRQVAGAIEQWMANDLDPSFLFRGRRLRAVRAWQHENPQGLNQQEHAFIDAGVRRERIGLVRSWGMRTAVVMLPLLVAMGVMWFGRSGIFAEPDMEWRRVDALGGIANDVVWDAAGTMYASFGPNTENPIAVSVDAGRSWQALEIPVDGVGPMAVHPTLPGWIYATATNGTFWLTRDGGVTWLHISSLEEVCDVTVSAQEAVYISVGEFCDTLYRSQNSGQKWDTLEGDTLSETFFINWSGSRLWAGRTDGLWAWTPESGWTKPLKDWEGAWVASAIQYQDTAWLATSNGMFRVFADGSYELVTPEGFLKLAVLSVEPAVVLAASSNSEVRWFSTDGTADLTVSVPAELVQYHS